MEKCLLSLLLQLFELKTNHSNSLKYFEIRQARNTSAMDIYNQRVHFKSELIIKFPDFPDYQRQIFFYKPNPTRHLPSEYIVG
jgi:hypothetical protein